MTDERCCANCARWERSSEEWEHTGWHKTLYRRVIKDSENDAKREGEVERELGRELKGRTMQQASCLGLGWDNWGVCNQSFGRGKVLLCWDERRGYEAPLYKHLLTAHDHYCREWVLRVDLRKMPKAPPSEEGFQEDFECPGCGAKMILFLHVHLPTRQEYWKGQCEACGMRWVRQGADIEIGGG